MGTCTRLALATRAVAVLAAAMLGATPERLVAQEEEAPRDYGQKADTLGTPEPEAEPEKTNRGRITFTVASDFTTAYFFRGILQERNGFIWQPWAEMSINLFEGEGALTSADLGMGIWTSFQTEKTLASGSGPSNLYEVDYYPSLTLVWADLVSSSLSYILYTSPNGAFETIQQLDVGLALDDSELLGAFAFGPNVTFSFEVDNTSFGDKEGGYFELAGAPGIELSLPGDDTGDYPVSLTIPLAVGLSLYDYYETETEDDTFGFFSFGANAGLPLAFVPDDFGEWSVNLGITVLVLSDTLKDVNFGDNPYPVGTFSIAMAY